jgi:hypothetical protein
MCFGREKNKKETPPGAGGVVEFQEAVEIDCYCDIIIFRIF